MSQILIKVDTRESDLLRALQAQISSSQIFAAAVQVQTDMLPIGDIIISTMTDNGLLDLVIFERKTVADLLASIKDGRYEEQSYRLTGVSEIHNHNKYYLIEGMLNTVKLDMKSTAYSALFSLSYYKGFSVIRSINVDETAYLLCNAAHKIKRELELKKKTPFYSVVRPMAAIVPTIIPNLAPNFAPTTNDAKGSEEADAEGKGSEGGKEEGEEERGSKEICREVDGEGGYTTGGIGVQPYVNVIKKVKKDNITPENIGEIMLSQIPGISQVTAVAIMDKYKSLSSLLAELERNNVINDIKYTNSKGQERRINRTAVANLHKYLVGKIS